MKTYGLTGGIGMGKSTAGRLLHDRGLPVVDTDTLARRIVEPGEPAHREIRDAFGPDVLAPDNRLRREVLARIVFADPAARRNLEAITHPRIRELWRRELENWRKDGRKVAVVVIPLLFETGAERELDATICVACSPATRRRRVEERHWTPEQLEQRIAAQWPVEKKMAASNFVVWSEGSLEVFGAQLDRILQHDR